VIAGAVCSHISSFPVRSCPRANSRPLNRNTIAHGCNAGSAAGSNSRSNRRGGCWAVPKMADQRQLRSLHRPRHREARRPRDQSRHRTLRRRHPLANWSAPPQSQRLLRTQRIFDACSSPKQVVSQGSELYSCDLPIFVLAAVFVAAIRLALPEIAIVAICDLSATDGHDVRRWISALTPAAAGRIILRAWRG
jgi:hypothetical protein